VRAGAVEAEPTAIRRRPRSRGVPAPARRLRHGLLARLRILWATMYPLPRAVLATALLVVVAYAVVASFAVMPLRLAMAVYIWGVPLLAGAGVAIFARGEPSDQSTVHWPRLAGSRELSEEEFDALEDRVDRLAQQPASPEDLGSGDGPADDAGEDDAGFMALVRQAIDDLPPEFAHALDHVAVVVSDQGAVQRFNGRIQPLYGLYVGYAGRGNFIIGAPVSSAVPDRIVIFRDTLVRDFGSDPARLRREVTRTLRHELAHHLGWDEKGVQALGL